MWKQTLSLYNSLDFPSNLKFIILSVKFNQTLQEKDVDHIQTLGRIFFGFYLLCNWHLAVEFPLNTIDIMSPSHTSRQTNFTPKWTRRCRLHLWEYGCVYGKIWWETKISMHSYNFICLVHQFYPRPAPHRVGPSVVTVTAQLNCRPYEFLCPNIFLA